MSIDEAIARAREVAHEQKRRSGICVQNDLECDKFSSCLKCAEEHERLAEWLEELKCYKNDNDFSGYADRLHKIAFNSGYNKALDDFVEKAIKVVYEANNRDRNPKPRDMVADIHYKLLEIAEQLKGGKENER